MLSTIYKALLQFLFPSRCPSCKAYTEKYGQWCGNCFDEISCNKNLAYDESVRRYVSPIVSIGKYDKGLRELIHELKYKNNAAAISYIEPLFSRLDAEWQFDSYDLIIPVPLHSDKLKRRGFNQVDKIFQPWAKRHNLNYSDILLRRKATKSQYNLNPEERRTNLQNAFSLKKDVSVENKRCLLVDDIFTTGATMRSCAEVLLTHGAESVGGLVLASGAADR